VIPRSLALAGGAAEASNRARRAGVFISPTVLLRRRPQHPRDLPRRERMRV